MTLQNYRSRRDQRRAEKLARIRRIQSFKAAREASGVASQILGQNALQQTVQPTIAPNIPTGAMQQFQAQQGAQRTANIPFLPDVQLGAQTAARDTRGKPEFGSFFGSGVLENLTGAAMPALENVQKGLELFGGAATSLADLAPGQLFAGQNQGRGFAEILKEVSEESGRGKLFDVAGQAQNLAEAFRRTDMPSTQVSLPGEGIPLPGGRKLDDIDVGVKGAIELGPEVLLGIATGGTSAGGSLAKRSAISVANVFGADIATGALKAGSKLGRKQLADIEKIEGVNEFSFTDYSRVSGNIERTAEKGVRSTIEKMHDRFKGPLTAVISAASPARALDASRALPKAALVNARGLDIIQKNSDLNLSTFLKGFNDRGLGLPNEVDGPMKFKDQGNSPFTVTAGGQISDTGIEKIDNSEEWEVFDVFDKETNTMKPERLAYTYDEVISDFFQPDSTTGIKQFLTKKGVPVEKRMKGEPLRLNPEWVSRKKARHTVNKKYAGENGINIGVYDEGLGRYVEDISTPIPKGSVKLTSSQLDRLSEVVTGKVDVGDAAVGAYDHIIPAKWGTTKTVKDADLLEVRELAATALEIAWDNGDKRTVNSMNRLLDKIDDLSVDTAAKPKITMKKTQDASWSSDRVGGSGAIAADYGVYVDGELAYNIRQTQAPRWKKSAEWTAYEAKHPYTPLWVSNRSARPQSTLKEMRKRVEKHINETYATKPPTQFDQKAADFASWIRHWQDSVEAVSLERTRITGGGLDPSHTETYLKMLEEGKIYSPRMPDGSDFFEQLGHINKQDLRRSAPAKKRRQDYPRKLSSDDVKKLVASGEYSLSSPTEAMHRYMQDMEKSAWDYQLNKQLAVDATRADSGVIHLGKMKRNLNYKIKQIKAGAHEFKHKDKKTLQDLEKYYPATSAVLARALESSGFAVSKKWTKDIDSIKGALEADEYGVKLSDGTADGNMLLDKTFVPTRTGVVTKREFKKVHKRDRIPAYANFLFDSQEEASAAAKKHFPEETLEGLGKFTKVLAETGDIIRLGRTGFDFGFWLIQGLPTLGFAVGKMLTPGAAVKATENTAGMSNQKLGGLMLKEWGKSIPEAAKAFFDSERAIMTLADDVDLMREAVANGLQVTRASTDVFDALNNGTILAKAGAVGESADKLIRKAARPFERAFVAPGDYIRFQFYKALRPVAGQKGQEGLEQLTSSLNNMTGALSSKALGVNPTLQQVERGVIAFSPRYTRACLSLLVDCFKGDVSGSNARTSMAGMLGLGMASYVAIVEALQSAGSDQELHLDPTKSTFMTFDIEGDKIGFGGFWTQFAKLASKTAETAWDSDAREEWLGDDGIRTNPLIRWVRGRAAPTAGIGWDVMVGEDFLGREIEGPVDWTEHIGRQTIPIWAEAALISDPYRTGPLGGVLEVGGARVRPLSPNERRRELRNQIAVDNYGEKYVDLNGLQRDQINAFEADMSLENQKELERLHEQIMEQRVDRGDDLDLVIEKYHNRHGDIEDEWHKSIQEGISFLTAYPDLIDLEKFRHMYLSNANAVRRSKLEELNDVEGEYARAIEHFESNTEKFGVDHPEDVAYNEYITNVIATDDFDRPEGFDYEARDQAINQFQMKWGNEVYGYVQERFRTGRNVPVLVNEFWQGRKRFEYYWRDLEEATLASMSNSSRLEPFYKEWKKATDNRQKELEESVPMLKTLLNRMTQSRKELRKIDPQLDAWLFRWGYTSTMVAPENEFSPDGVNDAREFWRDTQPKRLELFGIQGGIAL